MATQPRSRPWTAKLADRRAAAERAAAPAAADDALAAELDALPYAELRQRAKAAGVNANGTRAALVARVAAALS